MSFRALLVFSLFLYSYVLLGSAEQECGEKVDRGGRGGGDTAGAAGNGLGDLITKDLFEKMLLHRNNQACLAHDFFTYDDFIKAAESFPAFASTGDDATRKREIAAFLAQTSHETTGGLGGWNPPDGPYAWGYCFKTEQKPPQAYCDSTNTKYPCAHGQTYIGRGPIQLSWNYNYGQCGDYLKEDLLNNPSLLETSALISFKSAFWFWMTPQSPKPSCHDVITGAWTPSTCDKSGGRNPGYGVITNIINGGECGNGPYAAGDDRIGFYKRYCQMLNVSPGDNLDCNNQKRFGICQISSALAEM